MGTYLADGKIHKGKSVAFRISRTLVNELGWKEDEDGRIRIGIFEGTDKDVGFLQLALDPRGYAGGSKGKEGHEQGISISVSVDRFKHYVLNECPMPAAQVTHIVDGDTLVVECPDWLRFNPQSVAQSGPKPETKIVDMHPGRGRRRQRA
jgi:hypothetical protein